MNPNDTPPAVSLATAADWEILQNSKPEDYDGHTGFDRMTPSQRLAWLEMAVDFVARRRAAKRGEIHERVP